MGKKRRLNKLISKWIKSDLPDDCSSVLLLSVSRTPPSPKSKRRPFSLPLSALGVVSSCSKAQVRRNSSSGSNGGRRPSVSRRDSIRRGLVAVAKGERPGARPPQQKDASEKYDSQPDRVGDVNAENGQQLSAKYPDLDTGRNGIYIPNGIDIKQYYYQKSDFVKTTTDDEKDNKTSQELTPNNSRFKVSVIKPQNDFNFIKKQISDRRSAFLNQDNNSPDSSPIVSRVKVTVSTANDPKRSPLCNGVSKFDNSIGSPSPSVSVTTTPRTTRSATSESPLSLTSWSECTLSPPSIRIGDGPLMVTMETSVDSIGTCSLDMETSRELPSDWSEVSSTGTLRSATFLTPSLNQEQHHLPSYLSLACTVNGYSTTTNYDPIRLARSRDASPHRVEHGSHLTGTPSSYSVKNNLLSPPNLVPLPLPTQKVNMTENALRSRHQEFYSSTKTMTFLSSKETHFSNSIFSKDSTDGCLENTHRAFQRKCVTYESKNMSSLNDQSKCTIESSSISKEYTNGKETKSFIQQRVERLYGPGALAQGFFVSKRQKDRLSESEDSGKYQDVDKIKHNKTLPDKLSDEENIEPSMKQSSSSPSLPVLRHLRPEFRAQLPIASPRKTAESSMQKSITVPKLKEEVKVNGHVKGSEERASDPPTVNLKLNGNVAAVPIKEESNEKDGHYFIRILEEQAVRLLSLADKWELELQNPDLSEEVIGKIRSATGKARLLVSQKMQQFKGLCTNNINQSVGEAFPTTNEDLQGFWDMVMLQVDQVDRIFEEMNRLKDNNWNEEIVQKVEIKINGNAKTRKVISKPKPSAAAEEARKQREEQRKKMIEERRKAMKAAQQNSQPNIEIFVPESS